MTRITFLIIVALIINSCNVPKKNTTKKVMSGSLQILENKNIQLGVLPHLGGRIVSLTVANGKNLLNSDTSLWNHQFDKPIKDYVSGEFLQLRGHIAWVGPQSEWWIHQDIHTDKRDQKTNWPPDPFLIYGDYKIQEQSKNTISLLGPESLYTGLQLTNSYSILDNGKINIHTSAKNIRTENVQWDLWLNTRVAGITKCYVPISTKGIKKVDSNDKTNTIEHQVINNYFTFNSASPKSNETIHASKAFLTPEKPYIFAFIQDYMFVIDITIYDKSRVHPEHGMVEIYNEMAATPEKSMLELEYHGSYKTLAPGESMEIEEQWELVKYTGENTEKQHIQFIENWLYKN